MSNIITLPRQKRNFTCGIAAVATAAQLLGLNFPKGTILSAIGAKPIIGTDNEILEGWIKEFMPITSCGEKTYEGGIAIANIQNQHSGIGHYVTLLGNKNGKIRYWCPLLGRVFETKKEDIVWKNSTGNLLEWSINFESSEDFYSMEFTPERHVFIIGDPIEQLKHKTDTSLLIKSAYEARGQSVSWHLPEEIFTNQQQLHIDGIPVLENDIVWFRCDPVNTVQYYELLRRLSHTTAKIVNSPQSILLWHDKLTAHQFSDISTYTVSDTKNLKRCFDHLTIDGFKNFIVKSPSQFGGKNIAKVDNFENLEKAFCEFIDDSGYVLIQGFVAFEGTPIDKRVIITPDTVIGSVDRVAAEGSFLCNINAGATVKKSNKLSKTQNNIVQKVQSFMKKEDIFLVGLDFLGETLIEVNISYPSALVHINEMDNEHLEYDLIDACLKFVDRTQ